VTAPSSPSSLEVQRCVAQAIGSLTYSWLPSRLLPMLPNVGTEKFVRTMCGSRTGGWSLPCVMSD
jgi:hypothetical protein